MAGTRHNRHMRSALMLMLLVAACSESSRRPPTTPLTVFPRRLELVGPNTVPLGKTVHYTATLQYSDNTTKDVTAEATWLVSSPEVATVAPGGMVTGIKNGELTVSVRSSGLGASRSGIVVVPEGTYRLDIIVRDAGQPVDATIRVDSPPLGRTDLQTSNGFVRVYGVAGDTRLIAAKDGYEALTQTLHINDHTSVQFDLVPSRPRPDLTGAYRMTITAAPGCSTLPDDARQRSYDSTVQQSGPIVSVTLSGSEFDRSNNSFSGFVEPNRIQFYLIGPGDYYYYYYGPDVLEVLSPGRFFSFHGTITASLVNGQLRGTLSGWMRVFGNQLNAPVGSCQSSDHTIVWTR